MIHAIGLPHASPKICAAYAHVLRCIKALWLRFGELLTVMLQYTATQAIRRDFEAPDIRNVPIIAMTASAIQGDREKCEASGMNVSGRPYLESDVAEGCRIT